MATSLKDETLKIYKTEIEALVQQNEKYQRLGPAEYDAIIRAFKFIYENGKEKVRAQMLHDMIDEVNEKKEK